MELLAFDPENELELTIASAKAGVCSMADLLSRLIESNLYVSSTSEIGQDGSGFTPLLLGETVYPLVAVFSSLSRPGIHRHMAEYVLQINGREFFKRLPPDYGIALNPGYSTQLVISADAVPKL